MAPPPYRSKYFSSGGGDPATTPSPAPSVGGYRSKYFSADAPSVPAPSGEYKSKYFAAPEEDYEEPEQGADLARGTAAQAIEALKRIRPGTIDRAETMAEKLGPADAERADRDLARLRAREAQVMVAAAKTAEDAPPESQRKIQELLDREGSTEAIRAPMKATLGVLGDALSWANDKKRQATMPGRPWTDVRKDRKEAPTSDEWNAALRRSDHPVLRAQTWAMDRAALPIATPIAGGLIAATSVKNAVTGDGDVIPKWENVKATVKDTAKSTADVVRDMGTDPLNVTGFGMGGAKAAVTPAMRAAKAAGLGAAETSALVGEVERIAGTSMGTAKAWPEIRAAFAAAFGDAEKGEAAAAKAYGQAGEFFGKGQFGLQAPIPGLDKARTDLAAIPGVPEYAGRKALQQAYEPIRAVRRKWSGPKGLPEPRRLFDPTMENAGAMALTSRALRTMDEADADKGAERLAMLAGDAGLGTANEKRLNEIAEYFIDPDYTREAFSAEEAAKGLGKAATDRAREAMAAVGSPSAHRPPAAVQAIRGQAMDKIAEIPGAPAAKAGDVITPKPLPEGVAPLSEKEQEFVTALSDFFQRRYESLVKAGVLEEGQQAKNLVTGYYLPRVFKAPGSNVEPMVVEPLKQTVGGADALHRRGLQEVGGMPIGRAAEEARVAKAKDPLPEWIPERLRTKLDETRTGPTEFESNPLKILPKYNQQTANAVGRRSLEGQIADEWGIPLEGTNANGVPIRINTEKGWKFNRGYAVMKNSEGKEVAVPADLANLVNATFDQQMQTMQGIIRKMGVKGQTPVGKVALGVFGLMDAGVQRMKRLALLPKVGYHVINVADDTTRMWADGMDNPAGWLMQAHKVARGDATPVTIGKETKAASEWLAEAHAQNQGVESLAQAELIHTPGRRTERLMDVATKQAGQPRKMAKAKIVADAPAQVGEWVTSNWRNASELALYFYRRSLGDSPAFAAKRVGEVLLDYGQVPSGGITKAAYDVGTVAFPFFRYLFKSPKAAALASARSPARVNMAIRGPQELLGEERGEEVQRRATERGGVVRLGDVARGAVGSAREAMLAVERAAGLVPEGAGEARPGVEMVWQPRTAFSEAFNAPAAVARMIPGATDDPASARDFVLSNVNPFARGLYEASAERDAFTGRDMPAPNILSRSSESPIGFTSSMAPANTPYVPWWLEAQAGEEDPQMPWATRHGAQFAVNPITAHIINRALYARGGGWEGKAVSPNVLGPARMYSPPEQQAAQYGGQALNLFGLPVVEVQTGAAAANDLYQSAVQEYLDAAYGAERLKKRVRDDQGRR